MGVEPWVLRKNRTPLAPTPPEANISRFCIDRLNLQTAVLGARVFFYWKLQLSGKGPLTGLPSLPKLPCNLTGDSQFKSSTVDVVILL